MVLRQLKNKILGKTDTPNDNESVSDKAYILILEDDPDQMQMLTSFALKELQKFIDNENISEEEKEKVNNIRVISVSNIEGLKKVTAKYNQVLLALLDGNTPNDKDSEPHDQFIKKNHQITGKHRAIEIVKSALPKTPITMISSLDRFKRLVFNYYNTEDQMNINFINKSDQEMIGKNIGYYLRQYLKNI